MNYKQLKNQILRYFPKDDERATYDLDFAIIQAEEEMLAGKSQMELISFVLDGIIEENLIGNDVTSGDPPVITRSPSKVGQIKEVIITNAEGLQFNSMEIEVDEFLRWNSYALTGETLKYMNRLPYAIQEKDGNKYILIKPKNVLVGVTCKIYASIINPVLLDANSPKMPSHFHKYLIYGAVAEIQSLFLARLDTTKFTDANILMVVIKNIQGSITLNKGKFVGGKTALEVYISSHRNEPPIPSPSIIFEDPELYIQGRG